MKRIMNTSSNYAWQIVWDRKTFRIHYDSRSYFVCRLLKFRTGTSAGIQYDTIWDREVIEGELPEYEWLHLHHEDFTGQYSKFYLTYRGSSWLEQMVRLNQGMAQSLAFPHVPALKKAVAQTIRDFVDRGGFLFAMCTATETLEIALAADGVDVAAQFSDGSPMDPNAAQKLRWDRSFSRS